MLVPVVDQVGTPLQPTHPAKARSWLKEGRCSKHFHRGTFYIRLKKIVTEPNTNIILGIDPGSKRTAFTVTTQNRVVLNWLIDSTNTVKKSIKKRRMYRRQRRSRKTPYRECRWNRANLKKEGRVPHSTASIWKRHLRLIYSLLKILPITKVIIEDIRIVTHNSKKKRLVDKKYVSSWNANFSPLQVGKNFFYNFLEDRGIAVYKKKGWQTSNHRKKHGYKKIYNKLSTKWESQCVDSHSLCEMYYNRKIRPIRDLNFIQCIIFARRELFRMFGKTRRRHGSTRTLGHNRGTLVYCKYIQKGKTEPIGLCYLAGYMKVKDEYCVSLYSLQGKSLGQEFKLSDCKMLTNLRYLNNYIRNER
jgi:hypothetical protein